KLRIAKVNTKTPTTFFSTLAAESNSTTFLPLPIELFKPFLHTREVEQRQEGVNLDHSKKMLGQQFNRGTAMDYGMQAASAAFIDRRGLTSRRAIMEELEIAKEGG
ncbi:MAG: hypothetical protein MZW92_00295, partial [Comamonadaceae bacterium]|nr:hypothetical protein [Comamonadaceae bacterium]